MVNSYVAIDVETTGLRTKLDKIIEIGAVKVVEGKVVDTFQTLVNPAVTIDSKITKITSITQKDVENAPYIEEIIGGVLEFIGDLPLLGHRILFDYAFIKKAALNVNLEFEKKGIDTLTLARKYFTDLESKKLSDLTKHFNISHEAHRALGDAMATHEIYQILLKQGVEVNPIDLVVKIKKETPATNHQKEKLVELNKKYNITPQYEVDKLTKNEASRQMDYIFANYGR